jgi:hypothetical protein
MAQSSRHQNERSEHPDQKQEQAHEILKQDLLKRMEETIMDTRDI